MIVSIEISLLCILSGMLDSVPCPASAVPDECNVLEGRVVDVLQVVYNYTAADGTSGLLVECI